MFKYNFADGHAAFWHWLSKNPDKSKRDWPGWKQFTGLDIFIEMHCFACETSKLKLLKVSEQRDSRWCPHCPIVWPNNGSCGYSIYSQWIIAMKKERSALALQIANLPWIGPRLFGYDFEEQKWVVKEGE